ncbi:MAG: DUF6605 domain-containing protein [Pirellulales bacterium]
MTSEPWQLNRRQMLTAVTAAGALAPLATSVAAEPGAPNPIVVENRRPGTRDWMLAKTDVDPQTRYRCPWIEGYCSHTSVRPGQEIAFYVSTNPASAFTLDLYRSGFYQGLGGRHVHSLGPFQGRVQPDPSVGPKRVRECRWEAAATFKIPLDWTSGVYLGKLTALEGNWQSYVIFIVRDDRPADLLFQCSDTTWQAYNRWPNQYALYDNGQEEWWCGPDVSVSFDRPYGKYCQILDAPLSTGSGEWFLWEFPFAYWLEAEGYHVSYLSNLDTHADPAGLSRAKGFLSVGHDEYYSLAMYENLKSAVDKGLSGGFFSGNTCCGRIEFRPGPSGAAARVFERTDYFGPRDEGMIARFPSMTSFPYQSPHEGQLMGARNVPPCTGGADWVCVRPEHWLFAGTGMKQGDGIPGLVGWEFHGDPATIASNEVVASAPTQSAPGEPNGGVFTATVYPGPRGNTVFNASSCWWGDGLSAPPGYVRPSVYTTPQGPDARVQQITKNVLERFGARLGG